MDTESNVSQWGNSLAVRIPAEIARQWGVQAGAAIEMIQRDDTLVLRKKVYDLPALLSQITESNLHQEVDTGPPVGKEIV